MDWAATGQGLFNLALMIVVAAVVLAGALWVITRLDTWLLRGVDFETELRKGNVAVGIVVAALVLGLLLFASRAMAGVPGHYDASFRRWGVFHFGPGVSWQYFKAQGMTESGLDPRVCSHVGACGLMQFMPGTAVAMGLRNRFDARASIRAGIAYDRKLWRAWRSPRPAWDRLAFAWASYNAGMGSVLRFQRKAGGALLWREVAPHAWREPRDYVRRIGTWCPRFTPLRVCAPAPGG